MKKLIAVAFCLTQVACTTPARMSAQDLGTFQFDCEHAQEQYNFLESQKYTQNERLIIAMQMTSILGLLSNAANNTGDDSSAALRGEHEAMIKMAQQRLVEYCRSVDHETWRREQVRLQVEARERAAGLR